MHKGRKNFLDFLKIEKEQSNKGFSVMEAWRFNFHGP